MTEDQRQQFIVDFVQNRIFTSEHIPPEQQTQLIPMIFMVLALGGIGNWSDPENLGVVWEYNDKAGPRSINGYPIFWSMHIMHREDWAAVVPQIRAKLKDLGEPIDEEPPNACPRCKSTDPATRDKIKIIYSRETLRNAKDKKLTVLVGQIDSMVDCDDRWHETGENDGEFDSMTRLGT